MLSAMCGTICKGRLPPFEQIGQLSLADEQGRLRQDLFPLQDAGPNLLNVIVQVLASIGGYQRAFGGGNAAVVESVHGEFY